MQAPAPRTLRGLPPTCALQRNSRSQLVHRAERVHSGATLRSTCHHRRPPRSTATTLTAHCPQPLCGWTQSWGWLLALPAVGWSQPFPSPARPASPPGPGSRTPKKSPVPPEPGLRSAGACPTTETPASDVSLQMGGSCVKSTRCPSNQSHKHATPGAHEGAFPLFPA